MFHRSKRLFLRPAFVEDRASVGAAIASIHALGNPACAYWPSRWPDARRACDLGLAEQDGAPSLRFLVTVPGQGIIGSLGLSRGREGAELGGWFARPCSGPGHAEEATRVVIEIAQILGLQRLCARVPVGDNFALGVLGAVGFDSAEPPPSLATGAIIEAHKRLEFQPRLCQPADCDRSLQTAA